MIEVTREEVLGAGLNINHHKAGVLFENDFSTLYMKVERFSLSSSWYCAIVIRGGNYQADIAWSRNFIEDGIMAVLESKAK